MSSLHLYHYLLRSLLWPMLMWILLVLMCIIGCPLIRSMSFLNLESFLELILYNGKNTSWHGKQLSQLASITSCHLPPLLSLIKNREISLLELWISNHPLLHAPRLDNRPVIYSDWLVLEGLTTLPPPSIGESEAQALLWCLSELNFRFELLALHKHARLAECSAVDVDQAICNALDVSSLQVVDMDSARNSLHSTDWCSHLPPLLWLVHLMKVWSGNKPLSLLEDKPLGDYTEHDIGVLEEAVAQFYAETFFIYFRCAAVIPTCLAWHMSGRPFDMHSVW